MVTAALYQNESLYVQKGLRCDGRTPHTSMDQRWDHSPPSVYSRAFQTEPPLTLKSLQTKDKTQGTSSEALVCLVRC